MKEYTENFIETLIPVIQAIKDSEGKDRQDFRNMGRLMFQIYTRRLPRMVSVKAKEYNEQNRKFDLQKLNYKHPNKEELMLEHTTPLMFFIDYLTTLPTEDIQEEVLNYSGCCWVLKEEDEQLTKLGFRSQRKDWRKAYEEAGIVLVD